jgi:hypothetical protein
MANSKAKKRIVGTVVGLVFIVLLWFFRTWFHDLVMPLWTQPIIIEAIVVWLLIHWGLKAILNKKYQNINLPLKRAILWVISPSILLVFLIIAPSVGTWLRMLHLVNNTTYHHIESLPESEEPFRLMPYEVAYRYAQDSLQLSQFSLGTPNIAVIDGNLSWHYPLVPEGFIVRLTQKNKGIAVVNASTQEKNSQIHWADLAVGERMLLTDNLYWNLYRKQYFVTLDDPYYIPTEDDLYTVVPYYTWKLKMSWGLLYRVPEFAGVYLISKDGHIQTLSPQEAAEHPVLDDNRIFPENLSRLLVEAYQYHLGLLNKWFIHKDQISIQDVIREDGPINRQPFLMNTQDGLKWFISTEPYGASSGIFKIFLVDAVSGRIDLLELSPESSLTGPVRVMDFARRANPQVDWSRFAMSEPLPFSKQGVLFWKLAVVPFDAAGITYQVFIDSRNNHVYQVETDEEIIAFIKGEAIETDQDTIQTDKTESIKMIRQLIEEIETILSSMEE